RGAFLAVLASDVAETARDHDRLVIAAKTRARLRLDFRFEGTEVPHDVRSAELVVEGRRPEGALDHDVERGGDAGGAPEILLPRLNEPGNPQIRHGEPGEPRLRFCAAPGRTFIANLAAGAGRRAGERGDRRGVIVRLDLHQNVDRLIVEHV